MPALEDALDEHPHAVDLLAGELLRDPHVWLDPDEARCDREDDRLGARRPSVQPTSPHGSRSWTGSSSGGSRAASATRSSRVMPPSATSPRAYGLRQIALTGISPEGEPSPRALEELVEEVEDSGATTVFFETLVSPELAETVAREAGAGTAALDPLEGLSDDDLEAGADYMSVMRDSLATLRTALGCN